jgi:Kef-type K+ transport system membrane component KefB
LAPILVDLLPLPAVPSMVTELIAGILIGPHVLDLVQVSAPLDVFAQIGLVFLFFLAGLEIAFHTEDDRHLRVVVSAFAISLGLAALVAILFAAIDFVDAPVLVAIVLAATSFGIVVAVLRDAGRTGTPFGQLVIAGASVADFGTVILLTFFFSHQSSGPEGTVVLLVLFAALAAAVGLLLAGARGSETVKATVRRLHETTAQMGVRIAFLILVVFVLMASEFGLEVVLGAFLAGAMVSLLDRDKAIDRTGLRAKLEGIGFGVFIPIFFVISGANLNLDELFSSLDTALLVPATLAALLVARALPALLYRRYVDRRQTIAAGLLQATSLPFVVAATHIGAQLGKINEATVAGLVAGAVLSVLLFPAVAVRLLEAEAA